MRLRLEPASPVPIYRQIVDQVTYHIAAGRLSAGDRLPSVRELARDLPANQNTVLKAYELLERDGSIERRHGDGTFVASRATTLSLAARRRIVEDILAHGAARAVLFQVAPAELHQMLDRQLARLTPPAEDAQ
jgi:GntR family transcriptional regulator